MANFDKLNAKLNTIEAKRVDRDYIKEGRHVVKVAGVETRETAAGKEIVIIEADVISSTGAHDAGMGVKQIFGISNEPAWRIDQNLALIRAFINAAMPGVDIDSELLESCLTGGNKSALVGKTLMIIAREKMSKNDKAYLDFSYKIANEQEVVTKDAPKAAPAAPKVSVSNSQTEAATEDDDEPPFDI